MYGLLTLEGSFRFSGAFYHGFTMTRFTVLFTASFTAGKKPTEYSFFVCMKREKILQVKQVRTWFSVQLKYR